MDNATSIAFLDTLDSLWSLSHTTDECDEWVLRFFNASTRREAWLGCENGAWMLQMLVGMYAIRSGVTLATIHSAAVAAALTASEHLFENDEAARSADVSRVGEIDDEIDRDTDVPYGDTVAVGRYYARHNALRAMRWALQTINASTNEELKDAVDGAAYFSQYAAGSSVLTGNCDPSDAEMAALDDARERAYSIRQREIAYAIRATVSIDDITDGEE